MRRKIPLVLVSAVVVAACGQNGERVPVVTPIASPTVKESFSGTLIALGNSFHIFQVNQNSEVDITLTSVTTVPVQADPTATPPIAGVPAVPVDAPLSIRIGQSTITTLGVDCSNLKSVVAPAGPTPQIRGQALAGTFCVAVSDPNHNLTQPVNYVITVAHG